MDKVLKMLFYMHAGSGNHGCEAIAVSTMKLLGDKLASENINAEPVFITNREAEDKAYTLGELQNKGELKLIEERHIAENKLIHILYYGYRLLTKDKESFYRYRYKDVFKQSGDLKGELAISIGGDNYCYPEMLKDLILSHNVFMKKGMKTVLMGCSVEPDSVKDLKDDLNAYDMIIARESITYEGLIAGGVNKDKIRLCPDPAFALPIEETELPKVFSDRKVIGVNVSPMVQGKEKGSGITMENCENLIKHILETTDFGVCLIPHVVWKNNDDRRPLGELYNKFTTGEFEKYKDRIALVEDRSATKLKYIIGKCHVFVGARTHATIAAYSQCVPTLVIGYSVKSRGIAKDLFGSDENYVIPVQSLQNPDDLVKGYEWIEQRADSMSKELRDVMPSYIERAGHNLDFIELVK